MLQGRELLETWLERVWSNEDQSAIDELFHPEGDVAGLGQPDLVGPEEFKKFQSSLCKLLANIEISIIKYIESDTWSSALCTLNAVSRRNGDPIYISGTIFVRIENGQIQEAYNNFDFMSMWEQLGLLPPDSFGQGLNGKKLI